jgi:hypothetical protein
LADVTDELMGLRSLSWRDSRLPADPCRAVFSLGEVLTHRDVVCSSSPSTAPSARQTAQ